MVGKLKKFEKILLISFVSLCTFPVLYICRFLDNNTLTSWQWVFTGNSVVGIMSWLLIAVLFSAAVAYRVPIEKMPPLAAAFISAFVIIPLWRQPELLLDSGRYFIQAKYLSEYGVCYFLQEWGKAIPAWTDLPLVPFLYGIIFKICGETRVAVQIFTTFLFGLTVFITTQIGKQLWDAERGFYGGIFLLGLPYLLSQVSLMLVDVPAMFMLTLALAVFLRAIMDGGNNMFLSPVIIVLTMLVKYSTWPMLLVLPLAALVVKSDNRRLVLQRAGGILLAAGIMAAAIIYLNQDLFRSQLHILLTYQRPALKLWQEGFASTFFFQFHPFLVLLAAGAIFFAAKSKDKHVLIVTFVIIIVVALNIQRIRYIVPLLPLYCLLAAYGLQAMKGKEIRRFVALMIVAFSLIVVYGGYLPFFKRTSMMNITRAAAFIDALPGDMVEVYSLPQKKSGGNTALAIPQLDIFTKKMLTNRQNWQRQEGGNRQSHAPLLFSWNIVRPSFYEPAANKNNNTLVVISDTNGSFGSEITGHRRLIKKFTDQSGVFRYKTLVYVYQ